ncbi:hypothetical protein, partial [Aeromonas caviae]|uniref:hypothetical protein n=1 Tax=Aeromonas caviae TaxID=648 RepID=UPI0022805426
STDTIWTLFTVVNSLPDTYWEYPHGLYFLFSPVNLWFTSSVAHGVISYPRRSAPGHLAAVPTLIVQIVRSWP